MSFFQALLLGIIQGCTEFFPISSSAHVKLAKILLQVPEESFSGFDLFCHLGTLLASFWFLRRELFFLFFKETKELLLFFLALLPLFPVYFFLRPSILFLEDPRFLGFFWIVTSLLLFLMVSSSKSPLVYLSQKKSYQVLWVGTMQALALLPGVSRSGATISAGSLGGWEIQHAIRFSFLLAIPTILGGSFLEGIHLFSSGSPPLSPSMCIAGGITALIGGLLTGRFIFSVKKKEQIKPFAWYCLGIGVLTFLYFNVIYPFLPL